MYNVAIIGAGPAGIFSALEIVKRKPDWKVILVEKGVQIEKRKCLLREGYEKCPTCKKCGLLCGWGGAGKCIADFCRPWGKPARYLVGAGR